MVGNTYPYSKQDWAADIQLALQSGIDAFALNVGSDDWQPARVADAYSAAGSTSLKLFLSLDMAVRSCNSAADAQSIRDVVKAHLSDSAQFLYAPPGSPDPSKPLVSTFSGSDCTFGASDPPTGWANEFVNHPDLAGKIYFVPSFFVDPAELGSGRFANIANGDFNWNSGWPNELTTASAESILHQAGTLPSSQSLDSFLSSTSDSSAIASALAPLASSVGSTQSDKAHLSAIAGKTYMAAVSPWFFTHYGQDTFNKNWIYLSDFHLYATRWENLINSDVYSSINLVEIVTWNDFGESSYIGPIKGAQPPGGTENWTNGLDHQGWLALTSYYASYFKTGQAPQLDKDTIVMWARPQSVKGQYNDGVGPPRDYQLTQDTLWAVVLAKQPGKLTLSTDPSGSGGNTQTFDLKAGANKVSLALSEGSHMYARLDRDNNKVLEVSPSDFVFGSGAGAGKIYNFNAYVTSGSA
jgi:glucan endo-1,3-alpha-glucosidase